MPSITINAGQVPAFNRAVEDVAARVRTYSADRNCRLIVEQDEPGGETRVSRVYEQASGCDAVGTCKTVPSGQPPKTITVCFRGETDTYSQLAAEELLDALNTQSSGNGPVFALWTAINNAYTEAWGKRDHPIVRLQPLGSRHGC